MSSITSTRRRAAASKQAPQRRTGLLFVAIIAVAVLAVGALIAAQVFGGGSDSVPERVATGDGRVLGDPDAPVTIVEYADFQCPVCKRAESSIVSKIEQDYIQKGLVKLEFRMYPFLGQESWDAAQAADVAREQGKFWEYHDALFNAQGRENGGAFAYEKLVEIAGQVGLDVAAFEETLISNKYLDPIQREVDGARANDVNSTPTFFVGEQRIVGARDYSVFEDAIQAELQKVSEVAP